VTDTTVQQPQKPTAESVKAYVDEFEKDDWRVATDKALDKLFEAFPHNCKIEEVYLKVVALDDMYSTQQRRGRKNASALYDIAKEIVRLGIDADLDKRLPSVVDRIAAINAGGKRCGYVFASKYCHFQAPDDYPICENDVVEPLVYAYQKSDGPKVRHDDLTENYPKYKETVASIRSRCNLADTGFRQFDKFLWGYGNEWDKIRPRRKKLKQ
jgi:hypothetical protein